MDNTYAHVQPQATEIERAVLGALMIDKDAYAVVCETLLPESFYEPRNQKVYQAIMELSLKERPVDIWTVTEQLAKQGNCRRVWHRQPISSIMRVSSPRSRWRAN